MCTFWNGNYTYAGERKRWTMRLARARSVDGSLDGATAPKFHVPPRPRRDAQNSSAASSLPSLLTSSEAWRHTRTGTYTQTHSHVRTQTHANTGTDKHPDTATHSHTQSPPHTHAKRAREAVKRRRHVSRRMQRTTQQVVPEAPTPCGLQGDELVPGQWPGLGTPCCRVYAAGSR